MCGLLTLSRIYLTHGDSAKDKEFELEMSWISSTDTNSLHQSVPKDLLDDAETQAKKEDEDEEMGDAE
jgi:20S proteasome subunit alpha 7